MKITRLKANKFSQRVSIFLDGDFAFSIHTQTALQNSLSIGQDLAADKIKKLIIDSLLLELYTLSLDRISIRLRSEQEMSLYLIKVISKKQFNITNQQVLAVIQEIIKDKNTLINQTITKLKDNNYLDDYKFALAFSRSKIEFSKKGKNYIKNQLLKKGVNFDIVKKVLSNGQIFKPEQEDQNIKELIAKNYQKIAYKNYPKIKLKQLLIRRMISRGYSYDQVLKQIDEFLSTK